MRFVTTIVQSGNTTGIHVPDTVVDDLGAGKRPKVRVGLNGYTYRSSIAPWQGKSMISLSADNRTKAGVAGGDELEVEVEVDDEPRTVTVPDELASAFASDPLAKKNWDALSFSNQRRHTEAIESAKKAETRQRRIDTILDELRNA